MDTLLGMPVQSNSVQYKCHNNLMKFIMLVTLLEMCKFYYMFVIEVIVKGGVILDYTILRGIYIH